MSESVSIVIPVYNSEKYLDEAITSCINQTYGNTEIIAVDDDSNDRSPEILYGYSDKIKVISKDHNGIPATINQGIKRMKGNLFKVMNDDDLLYPECVELLVSEFEKLKDKKVVVHGNCDLIDSEGNFIREWNQPNLNKLSQLEQNVVLLDHNTVINITTILHKEAFFKYGFYDEPGIKGAEDYELWLRLCLQHGFRLHLLEKKLVKFRRHEESQTIRSLKQTPNYADDVRKLALARLDEYERQKYEIALKRFKKKNRKSIKDRMNNFLLPRMSPNSAKKISRAYRWVFE